MRIPTDAEIIASVAFDLPVGIWVARAPGGEFVYANRAFGEIMGQGGRDDVAVGEYTGPYGICTRSGEPYPEDQLPFVRALVERRTVIVDDITIHRPDGQRVHVRAQGRPVFDDAGATITHVVIAFIDISREVEAERARAESEARLNAAQRMESVGQLAGGIAHDFNNLLATIKLVAFRLHRDEADPARREELKVIDDATESGMQLTRGLLGFARRGKHLAARVSLSLVVRSICDLIQRTFDRRIELALDLVDGLAEVIGDHSQLEQVLMNLLVNARDAMPDGGRITVRTRAVTLDAAGAARHGRLAAGPHHVLEVVDTGVGIDPSVRPRIFEPYFTTKTSGGVRGVGLGLATVYGIVDSHGGAIEVEGAAPQGTCMRIWLPSAPERSSGEMMVVPAAEKELRFGTGTVLVVDDEPQMRRALARALEDIGYDVLSAADGAEAVATFRARATEIDAVLLDMVMPRMDGRSTYLALRGIYPSVPVVLTTGFALNEEAQQILDLGVRAFVPKPCDMAALSEALARVITDGE